MNAVLVQLAATTMTCLGYHRFALHLLHPVVGAREAGKVVRVEVTAMRAKAHNAVRHPLQVLALRRKQRLDANSRVGLVGAEPVQSAISSTQALQHPRRLCLDGAWDF